MTVFDRKETKKFDAARKPVGFVLSRALKRIEYIHHKRLQKRLIGIKFHEFLSLARLALQRTDILNLRPA